MGLVGFSLATTDETAARAAANTEAVLILSGYAVLIMRFRQLWSKLRLSRSEASHVKEC